MCDGSKSPCWPSTLLRTLVVNGLLGAEAEQQNVGASTVVTKIDSFSHAGDSVVTMLQLRMTPYRGSRLSLVLSGECRQWMENSQEIDCR